MNDEYNIEMDGFIVIMLFMILVNDGEENMICIGIVDVLDLFYDLNFLIVVDFVQMGYVVVEDSLIIYVGSINMFDVLFNDVISILGILVIIYINGDLVMIGSIVIFLIG